MDIIYKDSQLTLGCSLDTLVCISAGYSIFIVLGDLPENEADQLLRLCPAVQPIKPRLITDANKDSNQAKNNDASMGKYCLFYRRTKVGDT